MRFTSKNTGLKRWHSSAAETLADNPLLINCVTEKGHICGRPALVSNPENPIYFDNGSEGDESYPIVTDCWVYLFGRRGKVVVAVRDNLMGNITFDMKLVYPEGDVTEMGNIYFSRSNSGEMGYPSSFTVFSGRPSRGAGIYFICRQEYSGESEDFYRIMELSDDLSNWIMLSEESIYTPTLLANGRGDAFFRAAPYGELLDLPDPVKPQSRNLISAGFKSYFTTDSSSVYFTLPLDGLDDALVECEYSYMGNLYEFLVYSGEETSDGTDIDGQEVVMVVNRERGDICFKKASGADFPLLYDGKLNNLKVTAYKSNPKGLEKIGSMCGCVGLSATASVEESDVTVFYSSHLYPARIIWNSPIHPLYFPEDGQLFLGDIGMGIERVVAQDKNIYVFKEDQVFTVALPTSLPTEEILDRNGLPRKPEGYYLALKRVNGLPTKPMGKSVCPFGSGILYTDRFGDLYCVEGSGSLSVKKLASLGAVNESQVFAVCDRQRYMLFSPNKAMVYDQNGQVFSWEFKENILGGFSYLGKILLLGQARYDAEIVLFPVGLEAGEKDICVRAQAEGFPVEEQPVSAQIRLALANQPERRRYSRFSLYGRGQEVILSVYDNDRPVKRERVAFRRDCAEMFCGLVLRKPTLKLELLGNFRLETVSADYI